MCDVMTACFFTTQWMNGGNLLVVEITAQLLLIKNCICGLVISGEYQWYTTMLRNGSFYPMWRSLTWTLVAGSSAPRSVECLHWEWVGIRERVIEGVMITVWCHRRSPVPDLPDMYMLNEEPKLESRYSCRVEREERAIQNSLVLASVQIQIIEINGCKYSTVSCT